MNICLKQLQTITAECFTREILQTIAITCIFNIQMMATLS